MIRRTVQAVLLLAATAHAVEVPIGDARLRLSGFLRGLGVIGTEAGSTAQRPQGTADVAGELHAGRFTGYLEIRGDVGGPFRGAHAGVEDFGATFQDRSPSLQVVEGWAEWRQQRVEVRAGVQRFAWGSLDGIPPNDVLNPRDLRDPLVVDVEEAKLGVPAVQLLLHPPAVPALGLRDLHVALVYVPFGVPARVPDVDERWFPTGALPARRARIAARAIDEAFERLLPIDAPPGSDPLLQAFAERFTQVLVSHGAVAPVTIGTRNDRDPYRFDDPGLALRLGATSRIGTWNLYHYSGPETGPDLDLHATARGIRGRLECDPSSQACTVAGFTARARTELRQAFDRVHVTGADLSWRLGDVTMRAEAAYGIDRPTLRIARDLLPGGVVPRRAVVAAARQARRCLTNVAGRITGAKGGVRAAFGPCDAGRVGLGELFVDRDVVDWGIGADYLWQGAFLLAQVNQLVGVDGGPRLIYADPDTRLTTVVRRSFLAERLLLELRASYALERGGWFVFPTASYAVTDDWKAKVGYVAIGGSRNSLYGQYGANDEVVLEVTRRF